MSEVKRARGAWSARIDETATIRDSRDNQLAIFTHINTRTGGRRNADEVAANARIAAAAPELYEVAESLLGWREISEHGEFPLERLSEKARAALAKARGEGDRQ